MFKADILSTLAINQSHSVPSDAYRRCYWSGWGGGRHHILYVGSETLPSLPQVFRLWKNSEDEDLIGDDLKRRGLAWFYEKRGKKIFNIWRAFFLCHSLLISMYYLISTKILWGRYLFYQHNTHGEIESQMSSNNCPEFHTMQWNYVWIQNPGF